MDNIKLIEQARRHSRYLDRQFFARPWLADALAPVLHRPLDRSDLEGFLANEPLTEANLGARLRRLRVWVYAQVMIRDLGGLASLEEVTGGMTLLAELAVQTAQSILTAQLAQRHGLPHNAMGQAEDLIVIGMGKLGGARTQCVLRHRPDFRVRRRR